VPRQAKQAGAPHAVVVEAPGFLSATDLQVRLAEFAPTVQFCGDAAYEVTLAVRELLSLLGPLQAWVDQCTLDEVALSIDAKQYRMYPRRLAWADASSLEDVQPGRRTPSETRRPTTSCGRAV
jgi:hypothetical protein